MGRGSITVSGHDLLFEELERGLAWQSEQMKL